MKITKEMAKNAVAYINEHSFSASAYSYEDSNGEIKVYLQIDDFDFELSNIPVLYRIFPFSLCNLPCIYDTELYPRSPMTL